LRQILLSDQKVYGPGYFNVGLLSLYDDHCLSRLLQHGSFIRELHLIGPIKGIV
jgi:hypothetical protein